jgi:uncharacterized membrane protein
MLQICSFYPHKLWVAIMFYDPNCAVDFLGSEPWKKRGWWSLAPGQCKVVFGEDLADLNRYYCYYAEATDGAVWSGPYKRSVRLTAFNDCSGAGLTGPKKKTIGYKLLDIGDSDDFTLTLVP